MKKSWALLTILVFICNVYAAVTVTSSGICSLRRHPDRALQVSHARRPTHLTPQPRPFPFLVASPVTDPLEISFLFLRLGITRPCFERSFDYSRPSLPGELICRIASTQQAKSTSQLEGSSFRYRICICASRPWQTQWGSVLPLSL